MELIRQACPGVLKFQESITVCLCRDGHEFAMTESFLNSLSLTAEKGDKVCGTCSQKRDLVLCSSDGKEWIYLKWA